jgi:hypothetical protein
LSAAATLCSPVETGLTKIKSCAIVTFWIPPGASASVICRWMFIGIRTWPAVSTDCISVRIESVAVFSAKKMSDPGLSKTSIVSRSWSMPAIDPWNSK